MSMRDERERIASQLRSWRERLLDLTRGNPLLGINRARVSKLQVVSPAASELFDTLVLDGKKLRLPLVYRATRPPKAPDSPAVDSEPTWLVREGHLQFDAEPADIYRRLRRIRDNARTTVEERGVTTLHLTVGALRWDDPLLGESVAPLWLIPCALLSTGPDDPLLLEATDEDAQLNPALALFLRERHKKALPPLPEEPAAGVIGDLLEQTRRVLGSQWQVTHEAWLSTFSFEALTMYQDLDPERVIQGALASDVVRAFTGLSIAVDPDKSERLGDDLDLLPTPQVVPIPVLEADSSQLEALAYARAGRHLLVYGPPGTGKSQTIANLIADALGLGKTVLFVSAKKAALDVVFERLAKRGLDRYCLEAHSTKAGKTRIIEELRRTLEAAGQIRSVNYQAELVRYVTVRDMLNEAVRELHRRREPLGRSVYEVLGAYSQFKALPAIPFQLPWKDVTAVSEEAASQAVDLLRELQAEARVFREWDTHPWRGCQLPTASYAALEALAGALATAQTVWDYVLDVAGTLEPFLGPLEERSLHELALAANGLQALAATQWLPEGWTHAPLTQLDELVETLCTAADRTETLALLRKQFAEQTGGADVLAAQPLLAPALERFSAWYKRILPAYFQWKSKAIQSLTLNSAGYTDLASLARTAQDAAGQAVWLSQHQAELAVVSRAGQNPADAAALRDVAAAFSRAATIRRSRDLLSSMPPAAEPRVVGPEVRAAATALVDYLRPERTNVREALQAIDEAWGGQFLDGVASRAAPVRQATMRCAEALQAPNRLLEWVTLHTIVERCRSKGLGPVIDSLQQCGAENAVDLFRRRFLFLWLDAQISATPALQHFRGLSREALVQEFAKLDGALRTTASLAAADGAARRAAQINNTGYVARDSQVGLLRRELQRKRPRPLRRLFAEIPQVLQAIKPCMLMSPVSVSTYLTMGRVTFDIVVFDEASQLPPQETIPAIMRAQQVIVAGDDKQLPPTSFFSSALFAEEGENAEDADQEILESLLHECQAAVPLFQPAHLRWHYRSKDERLIAFSNHAFYEGKLITFPSPGTPDDRGVQLRYVPDGVWDRGKSRTNRAEARAVAETVVQQLEAHPERSMGIVALNVSQKEAIEDALDEVLQLRADLRARLASDGQEPFFVKSLENVQGDERDTMIISVGYGRDPSGTLYLNFGPLNQEGGWRRLNVLVTRAKYLSVLVTSLRSADLGAVAPDNRGAMALKQFIEYAERGGRIAPETPRISDATTNEFEEEIAAGLRARGIDIDEQVGASSFRIDLAVRDPRDPNWYVLGIECDGATYHSSRAARDRDLLRAGILQEMGWRLHRIWSVDWFRDPEQVLQATLRAVERAMGRGDPSSGIAAPPSPVQVTARPRTPITPVSLPPAPRGPAFGPGIPYKHALRQHSDRGILLNADAVDRLTRELVRVVEAEAPIHEEFLLERIKKLHGVQRAGANVRANFQAALQRAIRHRMVRRDKRSFLWSQSGSLAGFRIPQGGEDLRPIGQIAQEEMRFSILHIVESQFGLPREALIREAARVLGFGSTSAEIRNTIGEVVDALVKRGELVVRGFQLELP